MRCSIPFILSTVGIDAQISYSFYDFMIIAISSRNNIYHHYSHNFRQGYHGFGSSKACLQANIPPIPDTLENSRTERINFLNMGRSDSIWCWPSVGGVIMAEVVSSFELDFIGR